MDGILALWKEKGMTSHDCVFKLRKILQTKKIGHGGTLDPDVEGVLPIAIGRGTKVIEFMVDSGKTYVGEVTLGFATTTEDKSGEIVEKAPVEKPFSEQEIDQVLSTFVGKITQIPPMYSAVKVNGKKLYEYARKGIEVERPAREIEIYSLKRTNVPTFDAQNGTQKFMFEVVCGKGTYVRTLAVDIGEKLGTKSHMSDLTRTASAGLDEMASLTLREVEDFTEKGEISSMMLPIEVGIAHFPKYELDENLYQKVRNGVRFEQEELNVEFNELLAMYYQGHVVALYEHHPEKKGVLKPRKVFAN